MNIKPNRPVRVGTKMMLTDAKGNIPSAKKAAPKVTADDAPEAAPAPKPAEKAPAKAKGK